MSKLILNIDNSHFFATRNADNIDDDVVNALVDQYEGTHVSEIRFCVNCMKASYNSHIFEPIWKGYNPEGGDCQSVLSTVENPVERARIENWMKCALKLSESGKNVYKTWIARCRKIGISPWISTRMNDLHNVDDESYPLHDTFWRTHPELRRIPYHFTNCNDKALDFGRKAVRDRYFALIHEIAELYDMDGLELDWMRFGYHFRPGFEEEGAGLLTEFMSDVRSLLDEWESKRGHRIGLAVRVPSRPATALAMGMDATKWARKGLISRLVITPFWATSETDMPIEIWKQLLEDTGVRLEAGLEVLLRAYPASQLFQTNSIETSRGAAMSYLLRGADDIYLFNYFDRETCMDDIENYPALLRELSSIKTLREKARRHVVTFSDTWGVGEASGYLLPAVIKENECRAFRVPIGEKPSGQKAYTIIGFSKDKDDCDSNHKLYVNGVMCTVEPEYTLKKPKPDSKVLAYYIMDEVLHDGYNTIELMGYSGIIDWVEININGNYEDKIRKRD